MKTLIDYLSAEAKQKIDLFGAFNVGVLLKTSKELPNHVSAKCVGDISVYPKGTKFPIIKGGLSVEKYHETQPKPVRSYHVLVSGSSDDSGNLLGILKSFGGEFLYKPFDSTEFQEFNTVKYDYSKSIVKLVEPYSFLRGGGRKF